MLISSHKQRLARAQEKRAIVLRYLCEEIWTSQGVIQLIAGLGTRQAAHRLLHSLEKEELVRRAPAPTLAGQGLTIWGITPHGRALTPEADATGHCFEPSRLSVVVVPHHLMVQEARWRAEQAGWADWKRGETMGKDVKCRPDAVATRPDGVSMAIECERTIKTVKGYQKILFNHLEEIRGGKWAGVYYVTPSQVIADGLTRVFNGITHLLGGEAFEEKQRSRFKILTLAEFPPGMEVTK